MTVFKYEVPIVESFELSLPWRAEVLCVQEQRGKAFVWVLVEERNTPEPRRFRMYGTGQPIEREGDNYVGTFQMQGGAFVWHLFEEAPRD